MPEAPPSPAPTPGAAVPAEASSWYHLPEWVVPVLILMSAVVIGHFVVRLLVLPIIQAVVKRSRATWDDVFAHPQVLHRVSIFVPLVILHQGMMFIPGVAPHFAAAMQRLIGALMVAVAVAVVSGMCTAINGVYSKTELSRMRPIKGYLQVVRLIAVIIGLILVIASLIDKSPWFLLSGLGAMTAVLMLVFRDSILGLVAGVHLSANGLVHVGDWIEMPQFHADGDVIDISLNVVQVRNWDKTITSIPAYKFLEHSFKNWRGMSESGGRRIARTIDLDLTSARFCDDALLERLRGLQLLAPYIEERQAEIAAWNAEHSIDTAIPGNGRHMTNLGCFRAYITAYLDRNPHLNKTMTTLVRQMAPGPTGLPIQIWCFTSTTAWGPHEAIQADIFDHLFSVLPHFDLRPFQHPTGNDMRVMAYAGREDASAKTGE